VNNLRETFLLENNRHFVNIIYVQTGDYRIRIDIAKVGDLGLNFFGQKLRASAYDDIRKDPPLFQEIHTLLRGFGFLFINP